MSENQALTWMILEDDEATRDVIETMCELWEFPVVAFKDGNRAAEYLKEDTLPPPLPNVALLDIRNPGLWGHEVSELIRKHPALNDIAIIIMTAYELPGKDREQLKRLSGADRIIFKPLPSMDQLIGLVEEVIEERREMANLS
jgi:CheY-like chemotaxis protein